MSRGRGWTAGDSFTDTYADADMPLVRRDPAEDAPDEGEPLTLLRAASDAEVAALADAGDWAAGWEAAARGLPPSRAAA